MVLTRIALAWLITWVAVSPAHAWGVQGHRVAGHIANAHLSENTRKQLRDLLGDDDLSRIATWMDDERDALAQRIPDSPRWHYENRQVCGRGNGRTECPRGACITRRIESELDVLRSYNASREQRIQAVQVLAHLIGDLHQPLHLADNSDRGGNDTNVRLPDERQAGERQPVDLHAAWDTHLVRKAMQRRGALAYSQVLLRKYAADIEPWRDGSTESWARETHLLGRDTAYAALPGFNCGSKTTINRVAIDLTDRYVSDAQAAVEKQLARAGIRLAHVLNAVLERRDYLPR